VGGGGGGGGGRHGKSKLAIRDITIARWLPVLALSDLTLQREPPRDFSKRHFPTEIRDGYRDIPRIA